MPRIDDVKESEAKKNYRLLRRTSRVTPGNNQSVTGGRTRFIGLQSLIVIGSQLVAGLLEVTGSIKILGLGILDVAGPATFSATLDVTAETRLRGVTTLEKDLNVKAGGKVTVEGARPMMIGLSSSGFPGVEFPTGLLSSSNSGVGLSTTAGGGTLGLTTALANLSKGSTGVSANGTEVSVLGPLVASAGVNLAALPTKSAAGQVANIQVDSTGKMWRLI